MQEFKSYVDNNFPNNVLSTRGDKAKIFKERRGIMRCQITKRIKNFVIK